MKLEVTTFMQKGDGTRSRQVSGFQGASVLVSGERAGEIAESIVERFTQRAAPRRPLGSGGCVRIDERVIWLLNKIATGWSSSAILYSSWRELLGDWDFQLGNPKTDKCGVYWPVECRSEAS